MDIDNTAAQQAIGAMLAAIQVRLEDAVRIAARPRPARRPAASTRASPLPSISSNPSTKLGVCLMR